MPPFIREMHPGELDRIISTALAEDIGRGDITSSLTIPADAKAEFVLRNRAPLVVCGIGVVIRVMEKFGHLIEKHSDSVEGAWAEEPQTLLYGSGNARAILAAERTALNLMQHMSGIATLTRRYVEQVAGTRAVILDTRKTLPGLREIEKYAVTAGGGRNHRFRLDDGVLIKDNHISIAGSITEAVRRARAYTPVLTSIEVECDTLAQVEEAVAAKADMIMLDNMNNAELKEAVALVAGRIPLEASGSVSLETVRGIAETGVDFISVGKLTHSAPASDIGLDIVM